MKESDYSQKADYEFERVRSFFVDPQNPESSEDLSDMAAWSVKVMANIYAARGNAGDMEEDVRLWLEGEDYFGSYELESALREVLIRENEKHTVNLNLNGPTVVDLNRTLETAAKHGQHHPGN